MRHAALFDLLLTHSFYTDGRCPDLAVEPSAETARLLARHRHRTSPLPAGLRVVTPLDGDTAAPLLPLPAGATLRFHLRLRNTDFALFTDVSAVEALAAPAFTSAGAAPGPGVELKLVEGGRPREPGALAAVEILTDGLIAGPASPTFRVAFGARRWRWAYYCLTDLPANGAEITIVDASPSGVTDLVQFSDANRTPLDARPDPSDAVGSRLAAQHGMRCVRLLSDQPVACSEAPRKYLELRRGADRLAGPLPNPSVRSITRVSAAQASVDLLFQIVKYRANPFV